MMIRTAFGAAASRLSQLSLRRTYGTTTPALAKVLCSDPIAQDCVDILRSRGHDVDTVEAALSDADLKARIGDYEALIIRSGTKVTPEVLDHATNLRYIGRAGTGVDNVHLAAATAKGIVVMNTPGGNSASAAELGMAMIMSLFRNIPQACLAMKEGRWERSKWMGSELRGKTVGIVGLGRIGKEVAKWCQRFGMRTVGYDPILSLESAEELGIELMALDELWPQVDVISVHSPLTDGTRNLLDSTVFEKCKPGVRIVNCARGGIINEADLLDALNSGRVAGAALDVYEEEPAVGVSLDLIDHPNVICTPHIGASTIEAQVRVARDIGLYVADALDERRWQGVVNATGLEMQSRPDLRPWVDLGDRLGQLEAQLLKADRIKSVDITFRGKKLGDPDIAKVVRKSILFGILTNVLADKKSVNMINTPSKFAETGIRVTDSVDPRPDPVHNNLVTITVQPDAKGAAPITFSATLVNGTPRLVGFDSVSVDSDLDGSLMIFRNKDRPGALKRISKVLAEHEVNVAHFFLGREDGSADAVGLLRLDQKPSAGLMSAVRSLQDIDDVSFAEIEPFFLEKSVTSLTEPTSGVRFSLDNKPSMRPANPNFGSGPTTKPPGWSFDRISGAAIGRSHRSALGKAKLLEAIEKSKELLGVPEDYRCAIVPASDTGAFEMAMWSLLGPRHIDVAHWESFGKGWHGDLANELKLPHTTFTADYGKLPEMPTNPDNDVIFTWNGTTSGVRVPNADFLADGREGLALCDATSAVFAQDVPIEKLDVVTWSWQKVLGGEGAHGMIILSPKAVERLETYSPPWPMPKIFRMVKKGKIDEALFQGSTINTPSMLCVEDYLAALNWAEEMGGLDGLIRRANANLAVVEAFVEDHSWASFLAEDPATRSNTSVCLSLDLSPAQIKRMVSLLASENVAYDIGSYRDAPPGLRIWCGAAVETSDVKALMPWLHWAYNAVLSED